METINKEENFNKSLDFSIVLNYNDKIRQELDKIDKNSIQTSKKIVIFKNINEIPSWFDRYQNWIIRIEK